MTAEASMHRFTAEEYHLMARGGAFAPDASVELLDGNIVDMFPIGPSTVERFPA